MALAHDAASRHARRARSVSVDDPGATVGPTEETSMDTSTEAVPRTRGRTPYEHRLGLVVAALQQQTDLDAAGARTAAVSVLHAIDTIPEHIR
jgi:hypothetical protein